MTYSAPTREHADLLSMLLDPTFARQQNHAFGGRAEPIVNMLMARVELQTAKQRVPNYTAQWSSFDYIADEQATYDVACNDLLAALKSALS